MSRWWSRWRSRWRRPTGGRVGRSTNHRALLYVPVGSASSKSMRGVMAALGPWFDGPWYDGPWFDGPWYDGPWFDGPWFDGPDGPRFDGPRFDGPGFDGPRLDGPGFDRPSFDGPWFDGPRSGEPRFDDGPGFDACLRLTLPPEEIHPTQAAGKMNRKVWSTKVMRHSKLDRSLPSRQSRSRQAESLGRRRLAPLPLPLTKNEIKTGQLRIVTFR